jgi:hypothetical protein
MRGKARYRANFTLLRKVLFVPFGINNKCHQPVPHVREENACDIAFGWKEFSVSSVQFDFVTQLQ